VKNKQKVWVIGANGFTGRYLVPALEKAAYFVETRIVDIRNALDVERLMLSIAPDYVINLAGISFVPDGGSAEIYAVNTFGPQNILDACLKLPQQPKKIILVSTSHVYGEQTCEIIDESCPVNPVSHYGCSKWAMEQIAKTYNNKLNIVITRPFNYTGKGQAEKFLIPKIVQHFKNKSQVIKLGNIDVWRDFSDVGWIAQVYTALLSDQKAALKIVNLCSGELTSIREIIEILQQIAGHKLKVETDMRFVRSADMVKQCGDNQRLLKYIPELSPIPFHNTLKSMLQ